MQVALLTFDLKPAIASHIPERIHQTLQVTETMVEMTFNSHVYRQDSTHTSTDDIQLMRLQMTFNSHVYIYSTHMSTDNIQLTYLQIAFNSHTYI